MAEALPSASISHKCILFAGLQNALFARITTTIVMNSLKRTPQYVHIHTGPLQDVLNAAVIVPTVTHLNQTQVIKTFTYKND